MPGPAGRLDAVVICGGQWHDFDHARLQILALLAEHESVRTRVFEDYDCVAAIDRADLLITYTCNRVAGEEAQDALTRFLDRGGRWLALHGTNSAIVRTDDGSPTKYVTPRTMGVLPGLLGSQFLGHPPIAPFLVTISAPEHPLVAGVSDFEANDELYISELHEPIEVLAYTRYVGESTGFEEGHTVRDEPRPVLYLKHHEPGTVCYFTLGHCRGRFDVQDLGIADLGRVDRGSWDVPEFREILHRCIRWAATGGF
ncbi:ThuA domain-containing protein [Dietzia sp. SLG310A2-38A2]|uniref:ThuA domain-containing protein n=1 Tax=Dietzia sp. SLG310A2-38A2 TaxID=1630643 RepID=UPI0015FBF4BA|nr:ThuA domain-containing protein [Dietzia sp. SLG310A2-38A2]MBB1029734.1 ThuA domain-containing protein [Dietzia sp. SLG310A2-38A2]